MSAFFAFEQTSPAGDLKRFIFQFNEVKKILHARNIVEAKMHVQAR